VHHHFQTHNTQLSPCCLTWNVLLPQSSFIPGILGKKEVLDIILKCARQDERVNHPDMLSEYTAVKLFAGGCGALPH